MQASYAAPQPAAVSGINLRKALITLAIAALAAIMLFHLATLTVYPIVFVDEAWISNSAWTWLTTGVHFDSMHAGVLDQFGYEWLNRYTLGELPYVISFGIFGLGVFQARLVAWVFGCILLFVVVQVGRRMYSLKTGLLAALLVALSWPFLQATRWRQDMMLTVWAMLAFWLAVAALQDNKAWMHFAAAFLLGIGQDVHQAAVFFIPGLALLYLIAYGKQALFKRGAWIAALGGAVGLLIFAAMHILPSPEVYSKLMNVHLASGGAAQVPLANPSILLSSVIGELQRYHFRQNIFDLILILAAGAHLLYRHARTDLMLLAFTAVAVIGGILLSGNKTDLYAIHLYPYFLLIVAEVFVSLLSRPTISHVLRAALVAILVLFIGKSVLGIATRINGNRGYDYYAITDQIREVMPPGSSVMGLPQWWLGLADYDFHSSHTITYYERFNGYSVTQAMEIIRPDFVILDDFQRILLVNEGDPPLENPGISSVTLPRDEFMGILEQHGETVLEFPNAWHGTMQIYALDWDTQDS